MKTTTHTSFLGNALAALRAVQQNPGAAHPAPSRAVTLSARAHKRARVSAAPCTLYRDTCVPDIGALRSTITQW